MFLRSGVCRRRRAQDASLLPVWRHGEHVVTHGVKWRRSELGRPTGSERTANDARLLTVIDKNVLILILIHVFFNLLILLLILTFIDFNGCYLF